MLSSQRSTEGEILLDGELATSPLWREWRTQVGVVTQSDSLLSGSIVDNIAFFDPELNMDLVYWAAERAQIHSDIWRMPMRYLALVGEMGSALSGGQKQRLLLARALYRKPKILFLDEGTANLDRDIEEDIADIIQELAITRVVVARRPALVRRANKILRVEVAAGAEGQSSSVKTELL